MPTPPAASFLAVNAMAAAVEFAVAATSTEIIAIRTLGPLLVGG